MRDEFDEKKLNRRASIDTEEGITDSEMDSPKINKSAFNFDVPDKPMSAKLTINLFSYIDAIQGNKSTKKTIQTELENEVKGLNGTLLTKKMLNIAMRNLEPGVFNQIQASPGMIFVKNYLIEGIKNSMGEAILGYFDPINPRKKQGIQFELTIQRIENNCVEWSLADNGRGFPPTFLEQMATHEGRQIYLNSGGSSKSSIPMQSFGGAGRAIRMLIANVDHQSILESSSKMTQIYKKPDISEMAFSNSTTGGAVIMIKTSLKQLQYLTHPEINNQKREPEVEITLPMRQFRHIKMVLKTSKMDDNLNENLSPNIG